MHSTHWTLIGSALLATSVATSASGGGACDGCSSPTPLSIGANAITHTLTGCELPTFGCTATECLDTAFYSFTPKTTGLYSFSTCNDTTFNTVLTVAASCDGPFLACNALSESCVEGSRIGVVALEAGQTYIIAVGSQDAGIATGSATLTVGLVEPCGLATPNYFEAEPCGEDFNGGCNSTAAPSEPIVLGDTVQGTFWATNLDRDTDWYIITLDEDTELTLSLRSDIPGFAAVVDVNCGSIIGNATSAGCPAITSVCLSAGTYLVTAIPFFGDVPCDGAISNSYTLEVTGAPCAPPPSCSELCAEAMPLALGANPFSNSATQCTVPFFGQLSYNTEYYSFTPKNSGVYTLSTCGSTFDTALAIYSDCGGEVLAYNDDGEGCVFASEIPSVVLEGGATYIVALGSIRPNELVSGSLTIGLYESCALATATVTEVEPCGFDLNAGCNLPDAPAEPISLGDVVQGSFFSSATLRDTDWYRLTITEDTQVTVSIRSGFAALAAIVRPGCSGIVAETSSGDCPGTTSACLVPGEYFVFAVPTFGSLPCETFGAYSLSVTGAPCTGGGGGGSACGSAQTAVLGPNLFLTQNTGDLLDLTGVCDLGPSNDDRLFDTNYFSFTPSQSGTYSFSTCQFASFDTRLAVMTVCGDASTVLACNDDGPSCFSGTASLVSDVELQAGVTYFVAIGGASSNTAIGSVLLVIEPQQSAPPCRPDLNGDGVVSAPDLAIFLGDWGAPPISRSDFNLDGAVNAADLAALLSAWGACPQ
ncbi:MAG: hypothetical protein GC172_02685 [Phycisphaera sp.]|nr:hypothetical protein [Phycisphaera sp.]